MEEWTRNIRVRMAMLDVSASELAEAVGMTRQGLNVRIRRGPTAQTVEWLSALLVCPPDALTAESVNVIGSVGRPAKKDWLSIVAGMIDMDAKSGTVPAYADVRILVGTERAKVR